MIPADDRIRFPGWKDHVRAGDLVRWHSEQLGKIRLVNREHVTALCGNRDGDVAFANKLFVVTFRPGEFGMFLCWASPTTMGHREPIVYIPRFALYCTWHGWVLDKE